MMSPQQLLGRAEGDDIARATERERYLFAPTAVMIAMGLCFAACAALSTARSAPFLWALESALFAAMAIAAFAATLILRRSDRSYGVRCAMVLLFASLAFTVLWHETACHEHMPAAATLVAILLWVSVAWTAGAFWSVRDVAGMLVLPYWAWATAAVVVSCGL